jgi:hypothetical protein
MVSMETNSLGPGKSSLPLPPPPPPSPLLPPTQPPPENRSVSKRQKVVDDRSARYLRQKSCTTSLSAESFVQEMNPLAGSCKPKTTLSRLNSGAWLGSTFSMQQIAYSYEQLCTSSLICPLYYF